MRPPSYYTSLANKHSYTPSHTYTQTHSSYLDSNPSAGSNSNASHYSAKGAYHLSSPLSSSSSLSSSALRSSFSSPSSSAYAKRTHLPFVAQSTLVAHAFTGTRTYGGSTSGSSYSSSYSSRPTSTKQRPQQHSFTSSQAYKSKNPYLSPSQPSHASLTRTSYLSSRSTYTPSSSQSRPSISSYYQPIRLRERPLLTQISRQFNNSAPVQRQPPSERLESAKEAQSHDVDERRRRRTTALERAEDGQEPRAKVEEPHGDDDDTDWSSDVARKISRNKYLIKFREIDKQRPSQAETELAEATQTAKRVADELRAAATEPSRTESGPLDETAEPKSERPVAKEAASADGCVCSESKSARVASQTVCELPSSPSVDVGPKEEEVRATKAKPKQKRAKEAAPKVVPKATSERVAETKAKNGIDAEQKVVESKRCAVSVVKDKIEPQQVSSEAAQLRAHSETTRPAPRQRKASALVVAEQRLKLKLASDEPSPSAANSLLNESADAASQVSAKVRVKKRLVRKQSSGSSSPKTPPSESGEQKRSAAVVVGREKEAAQIATTTTTTKTERVSESKQQTKPAPKVEPKVVAEPNGEPKPKATEDSSKRGVAAKRKVKLDKSASDSGTKLKPKSKVAKGAPQTGDNKKQQVDEKRSNEINADRLLDKSSSLDSIGQVRLDGAVAEKRDKRIRFREYNLNDFDFVSVLGHGGWGFVILAELKQHDTCFAIKCIKKITIVEDDDFDSIMIERKMLTLGNINPFICKLFCTFETEGYLFFVMEYCAGGDLMFHVQHEGKFTESRCRFYAAEIICAIRFLHKRHIIYRDLKLDNILLDSRGHIRLVDFGMCQCRTYREELLPSNFCGTPEYISPEIIKGVPYNHSVDWWSFGVLLYEMAVGKMPFRGNDENELLWNVCYEQIHYPMFLSRELTNLLQALLEREPTKRMGMSTCKSGDICDQSWFRGVDWQAVEALRIEPPFVPQVTSQRDVQNFDTDFTQSACELSPVDEQTLARIDQSLFKKFPYTNPNIFIFEPPKS